MLWSPALITRLRALKLFQPGLYYLQTANITGRTSRGGPLELQKPFPYEEKKFYWYHGLFDKTMLRISEENAKIVVVDGPIAAGKSAFAKVLAEELDMLHIPEATADLYYILPSGTDLRQYDHELPKILRSYDHKDFCINPKDSRAIIYQIIMLYLRFMQLFDAMAHILNTGQGVVLERCFFSDSAFVEAMYEQKYISKEGWLFIFCD